MRRIYNRLIASLLIICFTSSVLFAKVETYTETCTYEAGEAETLRQARENAKNQVRRQVLDKIGTYVQSKTKVEGFIVTQDEIKSRSEGFMKIKSIKEDKSSWPTYTITAVLEADRDEIIKSIIKSKEKEEEAKAKDKELAEMKAAMIALGAQVEQAKKSKEEVMHLKESVKQLNQNIESIAMKADSSEELKKKLKEAQDQIEILNKKISAAEKDQVPEVSLTDQKQENGQPQDSGQSLIGAMTGANIFDKPWLKSAILPGWGQRVNASNKAEQEGQSPNMLEANLFTTSFFVGALAAVYYNYAATNSYDSYKKATTPAECDYYFSKVTEYSNMQTILVIATASIWAFNVWDAYADEPKTQIKSGDGRIYYQYSARY